MNTEQLQQLFSREPASLAFAQSADGSRIVGTAAGFVLDLWPDRAVAAAVLPPDDAGLAARNGTLLHLLLAATRPDWNSAGDWLAQQLALAQRHRPTSARPVFEAPNITRRVVLTWDVRHSRVTMTVKGDA